MINDQDKIAASFKKLLLFSGLFNIIFAFPLAVPFAFQEYLDLLSSFNQRLQLGGLPIPPVGDGVHALLINTVGIDLILIGGVVLYAAYDPTKRTGIPLLNAVGRTMFFFIILYYIIAFNIARIVLVFGIIDVVISAGFIFFIWKLRARNRAKIFSI